MTTKKKAQGGSKGKATLKQLKARAAEIIADVRTFDADTRREVYVKLSWLTFAESGAEPRTPLTEPALCERELREAIRKAEKGEPLIEIEHFRPEAIEQARAVHAWLEGDVDVPDFITNAVQVVLDATATAEGLQLWLDVDDSGDLETGGYSIARMARLFERCTGFGVEVEPKRDLAALVSAVLTHPDTPSRIYNGLSEAVTELASKDKVQNRPEVIRAALALAAEEEGGER